MKKFLKIFFLIIILAAVGFWVYVKFISDIKVKKSLTMVPQDAVMIIETSNLTEAWTEISNSKVWNYLTKNPYFNDLDGDISLLNNYLKDNTIADLALKNRKLLVSLHMISARDWDFLFVVDLKQISQLKGGIKQILKNVDGYKVKEREYKGETITEMSDNTDPSYVIYLTISDNQLVVSFTGSLIEKSIDEKNDNFWENNNDFKKLSSKLYGEELFRMYFNYKKMNDFSMSFLTEESETINMLSNSLLYLALNIDLRDELLSFNGYTSVDSVGSYVKALANIKPGKFKAWEIMPKQTAMYFSMGFSDFFDFYYNLTKQYENGNAQDMEDIKQNVSKIERLLDISLHDDFFSWIGEEIALIKLRPGKRTREEDVVIAIPAKDIDNAKAGLDKIMKKIKRRTPLKFKPKEYKNFIIQSLEINGFFKLFLGKMFKGVEKPFFTYIENNVVFSNSLENLESVIDAYVVGNTLNKDAGFIDFKDEFSNKSNVLIFIKTPQIYQNLYYYSNAVDRKSIKENKEFILSFEKIGFQLVSEGSDMFKTLFLAKHNPNAITADELEQMESKVTENMFREEVELKLFKLEVPASIIDLDTFYQEYYEGGEKIKYEGLLRNGGMTGTWKSYYESGNIKNSVNYDKGEIQGEVFFYFDVAGAVKKAEAVFEDDELNGVYFEYYENGTQKARIEYDDGKAYGDAEFYYPNGRLKIRAEYRKGLKHGKWVYYNEKGNPAGKAKWRKGELVRESY